MKKSIISLLSASIISMSLVGCQSSMENEEPKYEEPTSTFTECDLYDAPEDFNTLEFQVLLETGLLGDVVYGDDAISLVYKRYKALGGQQSKGYLEKCIPAYRHLLQQRNHHLLNECPNYNPNVGQFIQRHYCCDCGKETNNYWGIINDYMCDNCSSSVQCYDCGNEYNINSMKYFNGRSFHCGCEEEKMEVNEPAEVLVEEGNCGNCGTSNIDIMDNAGGYMCNECGHIGTINID